MKHLFAALLLVALPAAAETFEVRMLNRGTAGPMIYEPEFLRIAPGDTVRFIAATAGHNAASVDGMMPEGAAPFMGQINEELELVLTEEGLYGVKCSPHYAMGMVMLIAVGDADLSDLAIPANVPARASTRFGDIAARAVHPAE